MRRTLLFLMLLQATSVYAESPASTDTDGDGLYDAQEDLNGNGQADAGETNVYDADTDEGGEADGSEAAAGRDPFDRTDDLTYDRDGDGLPNGQEAQLGTDPTALDTDGDATNDKDDIFPLEEEYRTDDDKDGIADEYERTQGFSSDDPDDANGDPDQDGLSNLEEFLHRTDPNNPDSDDDGSEDGAEVSIGNDPRENPCLAYADAVPGFVDTQEHWVEPYAARLQRTLVGENGTRLMEGYKEGSITRFQPDQPITRFELLKIALLSSCIKLEDTEDLLPFKDLRHRIRPRDTAGALRRQVIFTAYERGIVEGYPDGTFRPDDPVNRAEALKILMNASAFESVIEPDAESYFPDVETGAWFHSFVTDAAAHDLVQGYGNGLFHPERSISRAEATKITYLLMVTNPRVNGYVVPSGDL